jgi:hypothetical protein
MDLERKASEAIRSRILGTPITQISIDSFLPQLRRQPQEAIIGKLGSIPHRAIWIQIHTWEKYFNELPKAWIPSITLTTTIQVRVTMTGLPIPILDMEMTEEKCLHSQIQRNERETLAIELRLGV